MHPSQTPITSLHASIQTDVSVNKRLKAILEIPLSTRNFSCLDGAQFLRPPLSGNNLPDRTKLISRVAGNPDVVVSLENDLKVADFQSGGLT